MAAVLVLTNELAGRTEATAVQHAVDVRSTAGRVEVTKTSWEEARKYARVPQGLPQGLDRASLLPRVTPPRR